MSKAELKVSVQLLHELLTLDADSGKLTWKTRFPRHFNDGSRTAQHQCNNWNSRYAGKEAFYTVDLHGYRHGYIFGSIFSAARVVFAMHSGAWPQHHIDHINGCKSDDRPMNLRDVCRKDNMRNRAISSNSSTGSHGVSFHAGKYDAYITVDGRKKHLGRFESIDSATAARKGAEITHGYHQNHGRTAS